MKNVMLATLFAFGLSAFANEAAQPVAPATEQPAAAAPAEHADHAAKKDMKAKKAHTTKKKKEEGK
ncbi:MAG: hypothetical protein KF799_06935 [Bdellovibrionales bacterium]|nr:hypothetical protein [Bdellovibrionales bacterium]